MSGEHDDDERIRFLYRQVGSKRRYLSVKIVDKTYALRQIFAKNLGISSFSARFE
jgi:hypothetical protein